MHKYIALFFSVTLFLSACKGGKATRDIISHDRMVNLLTEVHIVDGGMYSIQQNPDSLYKYGTDRFLALFKKFHTDSAQFKASLKYYTTQPVELQAMYDKVLANIKQKTDSLNKLQQKNALPQK
ncbi:MAG TPA: DUF4296 domain-containing protein [Mucilaginibacter sp.]|jgi:hypothetical protein